MSDSHLVKARLLAKEVDVDLDVCFNPKELQIEKTAQWESMSSVQDEPRAQFGPTSPASLAVTLFFDTYESKQSVYKVYTSHLERLIHIVSDAIKRPPLSMFVWGSFCFPGVVESLSQKYTMFLPNGIPVRCECVLKIKKVRAASSRFDTAPRSEDTSPLWSRS